MRLRMEATTANILLTDKLNLGKLHADLTGR